MAEDRRLRSIGESDWAPYSSSCKVAVPEAVESELAAIDGGEHFLTVAPGAQRSNVPSAGTGRRSLCVSASIETRDMVGAAGLEPATLSLEG